MQFAVTGATCPELAIRGLSGPRKFTVVRSTRQVRGQQQIGPFAREAQSRGRRCALNRRRAIATESGVAGREGGSGQVSVSKSVDQSLHGVTAYSYWADPLRVIVLIASDLLARVSLPCWPT